MTTKCFFGEFNPTSTIYAGDIVLYNEKTTIKIKGTITNLFSYQYNISFTGEIVSDNINSLLGFRWLEKYTMSAGGYVGEVYLNRITGNIGYGTVLKEITYELNKMNELEFSLVNLIPIGDKVIEKENKFFRGLSSMSFNNWSIKLKKKDDYKKIYEDLKFYRGYADTHIGTLTYKNGESFSYKDAELVLKQLYSYLSFICGRRIYASELKGYKNKKLVFSRFENKLIDSWFTLNTWYPKNKNEIFPELFQGFSQLWKREPWKKAKNILLGTYYECFTQVTLENKITSIQIALELISQLYLVDDTRELSNRKFKKSTSIDRLEYLFESMKIDLSLPLDFMKRNKVEDLKPVVFLVKVRNSIVHPREKIELSYRNLKTAHYIGLWMMELCFLRLFNYNGRYRNRLSQNKWHGDVESGGSYYYVPWRK